jgi:hypothetical protein
MRIGIIQRLKSRTVPLATRYDKYVKLVACAVSHKNADTRCARKKARAKKLREIDPPIFHRPKLHSAMHS